MGGKQLSPFTAMLCFFSEKTHIREFLWGRGATKCYTFHHSCCYGHLFQTVQAVKEKLSENIYFFFKVSFCSKSLSCSKTCGFWLLAHKLRHKLRLVVSFFTKEVIFCVSLHIDSVLYHCSLYTYLYISVCPSLCLP